MFTYSNGLNQIAKQANWLEMNGNTRGSDRLRILLEEHNYCSECGATQAFNPAFNTIRGIGVVLYVMGHRWPPIRQSGYTYHLPVSCDLTNSYKKPAPANRAIQAQKKKAQEIPFPSTFFV